MYEIKQKQARPQVLGIARIDLQERSKNKESTTKVGREGKFPDQSKVLTL